MEKKLFVIFLIFTVILFTACPGIPTPHFAKVEVLDSEDNVIEDCNFSVSYKGKKIKDLDWYFETLSDQNYEKACEGGDHWEGFKIGKSVYNLYSMDFSDEIKKGENYNSVLERFEITILKDGYKSQIFKVCKNDIYGGTVRKTIILEGAD